MADYFSRREEEKRNMRKLVEEVMKGHDSAREAKVKLQQMKQKIGNNQMTRMFVFNYSVLVFSSTGWKREPGIDGQGFGRGIHKYGILCAIARMNEHIIMYSYVCMRFVGYMYIYVCVFGMFCTEMISFV